jgi:putative addiction module component (TIGR02574 family)
MPMTMNQILVEAMALAPDEKVELAERLLASASDTEDDSLSPEWIAEIRRRIEAVDRGEMPTYPAEEVFERLRAKRGWRP